MKSKNKFKNKNIDPDLAWLHEDQPLSASGGSDLQSELAESSFWESVSYGLRSMLAIFICLIIPVLWYFDWNPSALANETSEVVTGFFEGPPPIPEVPVAPAPPAAPVISETAGSGLTDYVSEFKKSPYGDKFSMPAITGFYNSGLTIEYLDKLNEAGFIDKLSFPAIITYYESGVTIEYLDQMEKGGYLDRFSYPAMAGFYQSGVTIEFLNDLKEKDLLDDLSFADVLIMFENQ